MIQNACNFNDHLNYIYSIIICKFAQNHWLFMILLDNFQHFVVPEGFGAMMASAFRWMIGVTDAAIVAMEMMSKNAVSSTVYV